MSAICTCPEVDPVRRATTYTAPMGNEPHAVGCPRHGYPIVEPTEAEVGAFKRAWESTPAGEPGARTRAGLRAAREARESGEVFLVIRAPRSQATRARGLLHSQDWYKGSDVVVDPEFADDYFGTPVAPLVTSLRSYWGQWRAAAQHRRGPNDERPRDRDRAPAGGRDR